MKTKNEKARKSYLVWAPPYDNSAGGIVVLHRLAVELQARGEDVWINTEYQNKRWDYVATFSVEPDGSLFFHSTGGFGEKPIAIYPEIVSGNPFNAKTVVRYLLNIPGKCSPDYSSTWAPDDILYTYSRLYNEKLNLPEDRVMFIPQFDLSIFYDQHLPRSGRLVYHGKDRRPDDPMLKHLPCIGGKEDHKGETGQKILSAKLNRCELLYNYDNCSAITDIARLCGCPVAIIPDGSYTREEGKLSESFSVGGIGIGLEEAPIARDTIDSNKMALFYESAELKFQWALSDFIEFTQNA
ncbi:MAG: hypothetical protein ABFD76_02430 [Smithella sp.]